jgi:riboflavin kinase/FMN adenylyltransferase
LGTFDGVHLGHQELFRRTLKHRPEQGYSTVFTFDIPPEQFFRKQYCLLSSFEQKVELIFQHGIDEIAWVPFNQSAAQLSPEDFVETVLVKEMKACHIVCGFNFRFGHGGRGDSDLLKTMGKEYGFSVTVVPPVETTQDVISSTRIRRAIADGRMERAARMLGRFPSYEGVVVKGAGRGRKLGFPTANLQIDPRILIPGEGVYFTWCVLDDTRAHPALTSIGKNPTFNSPVQTVETYVMDFSGDLYNQRIKVQFICRMRDIIRYHSAAELQAQIQADIIEAERLADRFHLQDPRIVLE